MYCICSYYIDSFPSKQKMLVIFKIDFHFSRPLNIAFIMKSNIHFMFFKMFFGKVYWYRIFYQALKFNNNVIYIYIYALKSVTMIKKIKYIFHKKIIDFIIEKVQYIIVWVLFVLTYYLQILCTHVIFPSNWSYWLFYEGGKDYCIIGRANLISCAVGLR